MSDLTRGELAKLGGVNPETIRYYERSGLLPEAPRSEAGYRLFDPNTVRRIRFIKRAQAVGFSLNEIKRLLDIKVAADATRGDVREMVSVKIVEIDEKIEALNAMKHTLTQLEDMCCGDDHPASECPILEHFEDGVE
ncbi:MAG: heavy metal-responsive transcriptional regulator [Anaerolineae bacterium]